VGLASHPLSSEERRTECPVDFLTSLQGIDRLSRMLFLVERCVKRLRWTSGMAVACAVGAVLLAHPCRGLAQDADVVNQSSPSPYSSGQETALEGIEAAKESSEDLDPNLVPLEPELTASPPDLSSSDNSVEMASVETAASAGSSGPQETLYNIPVANQSSPSPYSVGQEAALEGIDAAQENGDDLDPNLIPLEPELTTSPPDLSSSSDNSMETPSDETPSVETAGSAESSGPQETLYNIPVVIDQSVQSHIRFFNTSIRDRFEQWMVRLNRYRPLVENIFAEFNLPSDLVHLSLVESGFNPYAYSRAKATGPWQFMKGTGKLYGLRIDHYVDERRDPIKSTVAAARYLRDLYDIFGTWPLAMAAYNAGEGKVLRALHKAQAESFSEISRTKLIRLETKQYVPRIMAATIIARNPDQYGFTQNPVSPHEFEEVVVTRPLHFRAISNVTGISYNDLRLLNPELRRDATPPDETSYHLKVPIGMSSKVLELLERVPTHKFPPVAMMADREAPRRPKAGASRWYRVRMGDTLQKISRKFGIPIKTIKTRNNISGPVIRAGQLLNLAR